MSIKTDKSSIWGYYKQRLDYQNKMGFSSKWPEMIRFKEGNQWPAPTKDTKTLPRPVINQIDFIIKNKLSNTLSPTLKMIFSADEMPDDESMQDLVQQLTQAAEDYTDATENTYHDIDQDILNEECVGDVLTLGTGITYYYFNNEAKGGQFTPYKGKIDGEVLDPMDVFFDNPKGKFYKIDTEQRFIIFRKPMDTDIAKDIAKAKGGEPLLIVPDGQGNKDEKYDNGKQDVLDSNITTTLVMLYKDKGEMYWTQITESALMVPPTRLAPQTSQKGFEIYPIDVLVFDTRKKCIYGRSICEDLIPIQKYLNWGLGMMMKGIEQTAWPKILAKVGALAGQVITNTPGEIVTDHFATPGVDGIKYMQPPNFSNEPVILAEKLIEMVRQVTGTTEVNSGEVIGANMAASAILALQAQAQKPNVFNQNKYFKSMEHKGRIWEEFYKCYYNLPRPIQSKDENGQPVTKKFVGTDSADLSFGLKLDVGPGSMLSESLQMTMLKDMYEKKDITKYQYVKYAPRNSVPQELKSDFEKEEEQMKANPPQPPEDRPNITISYSDLPQDAQVQLLAQIGIKSNGGLSTTDQANINLKQQELLKNTLDSHSKHVNSTQGGQQNGLLEPKVQKQTTNT